MFITFYLGSEGFNSSIALADSEWSFQINSLGVGIATDGNRLARDQGARFARA